MAGVLGYFADPNFAWEKQYYVGVAYWGHVWRAFANKLLLPYTKTGRERERQKEREAARDTPDDATCNNQLATLLLLPVVVVVVVLSCVARFVDF